MAYRKGYREVSGAVKQAVKRRDKFKCVKCGSRNDLEVDHIVSDAKGGSNAMSNLQTLCKLCHSMKTKQEIAEAHKEMHMQSLYSETHPFDIL